MGRFAVRWVTNLQCCGFAFQVLTASQGSCGKIWRRFGEENGQLLESKGNGKMLKELINKYDLQVANFKPDTDGKWTRIQKKGNVLCKSIIDYIITDSSTSELVNNTVIDEDKMYTPYRCKKTGKNKTLVYSDHCSINTTINNIQVSAPKMWAAPKM